MSDHEGERELVLGNRQLLGIFFVATLLCGVFFAMGYVVGGNSAKAGAAAAAATDSAPVPVSEGKREEPRSPLDGGGGSTNPNVNASNPAQPAPSDTGAQLPGAEPKVADNPIAAGAQPPASVAIVPAPAQPAQTAPTPKRTAPVVTAAPVAGGVFLSVPEAGASYLQVAAVQRPSADDLVMTLRRGGLPVILATSSKPELFEVLVGPYRSALTLADAKRKLTDLGYGHLVVHK
jgi:hypothetical protein